MALFRKSRTAAGSMIIPPDYDGQPVSVESSDGTVRGEQDRMHAYIHSEGLARFSVAFVADASTRVRLCAEAYIPGLGWVQDFDIPEAKEQAETGKTINALISKFRGKYTTAEQTMWNLIWHKRSVGELYLVHEDDLELGITYTPYSYKAVSRQPGGEGGKSPGYKIMDRAGGRIGNGARWVPDAQVERIWTPHPDFPLQPYSALWAGLRDLDRYTLLGKVIDRSANSALLNRGLLWFPGEAMDDMVNVGGKQMPKLARDYYASANTTMKSKDDSDVSAVAPFAVWWDSDFGEPRMIKFSMPMESSWFDMRTAVIADFARTVDLPSVMVINGGAGGSSGTDGSSSNHWSDLLVDRRTFDMTIGRDLDTVTHEDLTRAFLKPQLKAKDDLGAGTAWRVGYDPTPLIVNQDRSLFALDSVRIGLISYKAGMKRLGFRPDEAATEDDLKKLAALVTRSAQADGSTRRRMRQDSTNMGGQGTDNVLPHAAAAVIASMSPRQLVAAAAAAIQAEDGIAWLDA